jgi:hypothetical protein
MSAAAGDVRTMDKHFDELFGAYARILERSRNAA